MGALHHGFDRNGYPLSVNVHSQIPGLLSNVLFLDERQRSHFKQCNDAAECENESLSDIVTVQEIVAGTTCLRSETGCA